MNGIIENMVDEKIDEIKNDYDLRLKKEIKDCNMVWDSNGNEKSGFQAVVDVIKDGSGYRLAQMHELKDCLLNDILNDVNFDDPDDTQKKILQIPNIFNYLTDCMENADDTVNFGSHWLLKDWISNTLGSYVPEWCPSGVDATGNCADCVYSKDYHLVDGECAKRKDDPEM